MAEASEQIAQAESYVLEQLEQIEKRESQLAEDKSSFELEKEEWRAEADYELDKLLKADENAARNALALMALRNGTILTLDLDIESQNIWKVRIKYENVLLGEISSENSGNFAEELIKIMESAGLEKDDVIIGVLMYDSSDKGSYFKSDFEKYTDEVQNVYRQFYCASINIK